MAVFTAILDMIGLLAVGVALFVLARLSRRLGEVTHARPYYRLLYLAALMVWGGVGARLVSAGAVVASELEVDQNIPGILLRDGLPALGVTLGLLVTWYYWSWLLAERD